MTVLEASRLGAAVEELCLEVSTVLPADVVDALASARGSERSPTGRRALDMILENARAAESLGVPICQDTGTFTVFLTVPPDTELRGDIAGELRGAVAGATEKGALRASVVENPLDGRRNTGDNTPPLVKVELTSGGSASLGVIAKGGGTEMASRLAMLPPGAGWRGVLDFALRVVREAGARSCPPLVVGVGVGGGFDEAPALAKKALLEPLDRGNPDPVLAGRERELVDALNGLGIGPGALGGSVTCIGARLLEAPCHMANLPVAVNVNCHALRRKSIGL